MKCLHCKGEMERGSVPFHVDHKGIQLTLEKMPAWVCRQCGEPLFEEGEVASMQEILRSVDRQAEKLLEIA